MTSCPQRKVSLSILVPVYNERYLAGEALRRILSFRSERVSEREVIVVDDGSTDGTGKILEDVAARDEGVRLLRHERNLGKGAAIRSALSRATKEICVVHDADLEYRTEDLDSMIRPFIEEGADAVFGSRYLPRDYRRLLYFRHSALNWALSFAASSLTDVHFSDVQTGHKMFRTEILRSIPLRSDDFRIEIELSFKAAKRGLRIFEVPIRYSGRSYAEGKKIRPRDGLLASWVMLKYAIIDDIYQDDPYGAQILLELERAHAFTRWMADRLRPHLGARILEIGAGIGTLTRQFIPRERYLASDVNPSYLHFLGNYAIGKPYLEVREIDAARPEHFRGLEASFDTALLINVLEHLVDETGALRNVRSVLSPGGKIVVLVPQHPGLYGSLDEVLEHRRRYTPEGLRRALEGAGFNVEIFFDFNRTTVPAWFWNGRVLRRKRFSRVQLKIFDLLVPILRRLDALLPWKGLSLVAIARRPTDAR